MTVDTVQQKFGAVVSVTMKWLLPAEETLPKQNDGDWEPEWSKQQSIRFTSDLPPPPLPAHWFGRF